MVLNSFGLFSMWQLRLAFLHLTVYEPLICCFCFVFVRYQLHFCTSVRICIVPVIGVASSVSITLCINVTISALPSDGA